MEKECSYNEQSITYHPRFLYNQSSQRLGWSSYHYFPYSWISVYRFCGDMDEFLYSENISVGHKNKEEYYNLEKFKVNNIENGLIQKNLTISSWVQGQDMEIIITKAWCQQIWDSGWSAQEWNTMESFVLACRCCCKNSSNTPHMLWFSQMCSRPYISFTFYNSCLFIIRDILNIEHKL